jgi:hypothetical protein
MVCKFGNGRETAGSEKPVAVREIRGIATSDM